MALRSITDPLISLLFPLSCHNCGKPVEQYEYGVACDECWQATRFFKDNDPLCEKCGALLPSESFQRCSFCDDQHFDFVVSVGVYEAALSKCIINLKKVDQIPERLRRLTESRLNECGKNETDLIIPMPLSRKRRYERSFNQAESIGRIVAEFLSKPMDRYSLARTSHTQMHRAAMDRKARELSVKDSFAVTRANLIDGKKILLVDDILTSGSTASHCARVLKKAGAAQVNVFTLARAVIQS